MIKFCLIWNWLFLTGVAIIFAWREEPVPLLLTLILLQLVNGEISVSVTTESDDE